MTKRKKSDSPSKRRDPQIFEPEYYERLQEIEERHWWARGMRAGMDALLVRELRGSGPLRVADVGCGTGFLLEHLARRVSIDRAAGLDLSWHALLRARDRGRTDVMIGSALDLPLPDGTFDLVTCIDTLQHLPEGGEARAMREMARLLRPGGILYARSNSAFGQRQVTKDDYRRFRIERMSELARDAGLVVVRATYLNALPSLWGIVRERLRPPPAHADSGHAPGLGIRLYPSSLAWLNEILYGVLAIEAKLAGRVNLPFGHATALVARKPEV
ncbi:MAG TPA: class I SAM-dependent methyltransferase [Thermoanaerobaculia bacterium]|nr:class I SAM-dependent methyltransferase [Thermoanaerobaculia bacterium]